MNILKKSFFAFILTMACLSIKAQTIVWEMPLSQYDKIEYWGNNLWLATKNGKIGLIQSNGTIIAPIENEKISDFYDHKALLTFNDSKGERVMGCLTDNGQYHDFKKRCYTLAGQKFFSDDLVSVSDENGKLGYVDCDGNPIIGFNDKYDRIKPFTEGYAAVFKNRKYHLIDKEGQSVRFLFNGVGEVYGGTNVFNGLAYVWDTDGKYYTYDTRKGGACKSAKIPGSQQGFDYLYRFMAISGQNKTIPFKSVNRQISKGIAPSISNGVYGYNMDGRTIIPYQFSGATQFENGYAVVTLNGQKGIIKYVDDDSFNATSSTSSFNYHEGETVNCQFQLVIPHIWQGKKISLILKDETQNIAISQNASTYSFKIKPTSSRKQSQLEIEGEGLILYRTTLSYTFVRKERCPECGKDKDACPYNGHHPAKNISKPAEKGTHHSAEKKSERICPTCGKPISRCKYQGVH